MKEVSILLTKYSDWISSMVYMLCGKGYTHASIGLEEDPDTYYSFNYRGFAIETVEKHKRRGVKKSKCYQWMVPDDTYEEIKHRIQDVKEDKDSYRYTRLGVLCCVLHIPLHWKKHYFCSQFVAELLEKSGAVSLSRSPSCFLPNHFIPLMENQHCLVLDNVV